MRNLFVYLQYPRVIGYSILYNKMKKTDLQAEVNADILRYLPEHYRNRVGSAKSCRYLLITHPIFRTVFLFRINSDKKLQRSVLKAFGKMLLPPLPNIEIGGKIGGGLRIVHTAGCTISPMIAGKNLSVYQGVTIGSSSKEDKDGNTRPVIGDDVSIMANAVVAGGIHIGNDVMVGAGSVVMKDVPDNCTVVGNPARMIRQNNEKVNLPL